MQILKKTSLLCLLLSSALLLQGCYLHSKITGKEPRIQHHKTQNNDPLEPINRFIFGFNRGVDTIILKPAATIYKEGAPRFVQKGVRNFLRNLKSPTTLANHTLQGQGQRAGRTIGRFIVNSTLGIGGLFDVASEMGMPYEAADFGQTLGVWGVGPGPYLMLPLLGPSDMRDGIGLVADSYADPLNRYADNTDQHWIIYTRLGLTILDARAEALEVTNDLEKNSLDYYASIRSMYLQHRKAFVKKGKGIKDTDTTIEHQDDDYYPEYPDYEDEPE